MSNRIKKAVKELVISFYNGHLDTTTELPACLICCGECDGRGGIAYGVDDNGITGSEWAEWDQCERDTYMEGGYDLPCRSCNGTGMEKVVYEPHCEPEDLAAYEAHLKSEAEYERERESERRMGC